MNYNKMSREAIDAALAAHTEWKKRLQDAISTGQSEFKPEVVKTDNACQFGKWLYSLPFEFTNSDDYIKVKNLHADFHIIAGDILNLALSGKKDEAQLKLALGGTYNRASGKLVLALQNWKDTL